MKRPSEFFPELSAQDQQTDHQNDISGDRDHDCVFLKDGKQGGEIRPEPCEEEGDHKQNEPNAIAGPADTSRRSMPFQKREKTALSDS